MAKSNISDGYGLVYADHKLHVFLPLLLTSMVYHGYTTDGFNIATIQRLVKKTRGNQQMTLTTIEPLLLVAPVKQYLIRL